MISTRGRYVKILLLHSVVGRLVTVQLLVAAVGRQVLVPRVGVRAAAGAAVGVRGVDGTGARRHVQRGRRRHHHRVDLVLVLQPVRRLKLLAAAELQLRKVQQRRQRRGRRRATR